MPVNPFDAIEIKKDDETLVVQCLYCRPSKRSILIVKGGRVQDVTLASVIAEANKHLREFH